MYFMERAHVFISGKVQGIGFRGFVRRKAKQIGVNGWVKNLEDGRVEAVFEGWKIEQILEECKKGPPFCVVDKVEIIKENVKGEKDFEIRC